MFVRGNVVEYAHQEVRFTGGGANLGGPNAGNGQKASKPPSVAGNECEGLNRKLFSLFRVSLPRRSIGQVALVCEGFL